ncbi:CvpA family protein [Neisseria weaveri]|uniref:Bacteriocin production protein n=1 Tax=Neisseria weaveri TaxID=28091 RepID=A0A448VQ78_9NEIS|nr:CvpA family protein [Neisseria weaveri]EGV35578.1 hypothetical protein l13_15950 [Neisseria weaveri ATCC 51223]EGV37671.1 hypothetical protein l11_09120 [Neisseria weaveri LMG 5135]SAY50531.1 bacteriocin production protein [Neisseria weaveri]VEJ51940.1 bacteriocin production protein [Neisseria weaveri]
MAVFDIVALLVVAVCVVISLVRGAVAEIAAFFRWIAAFVAAKVFAAPFAEIAFHSVEPRQLGVVLAFIAVFFAAWLIQHFLIGLLTAAVSAVGLGGVNRLLGGLFGAAKGVLLVTLAVLVCSFTDLPQTEGWRLSVSAPYFEALAAMAVPYLPPVVAEQIQNPLL